MSKRKPYTLQLMDEDQDIYNWLQSLPSGTKQSTVKAALRAYMPKSFQDAEPDALARIEKAIADLPGQLGAQIARHRGPVGPIEESPVDDGQREVDPEFVQNVAQAKRPGFKRKG